MTDDRSDQLGTYRRVELSSVDQLIPLPTTAISSGSVGVPSSNHLHIQLSRESPILLSTLEERLPDI